ncbi:MAG: hypothetical protein ABEI27_03010 [Halobellus sp.]|uniref:hypothetical protein n=1 Tax=Halobellus sp. TaxID=1979212 RepID=UPI0035D4D80F
MVVVSAVAFAASLLCFYSGARALQTKNAVARLRADDRFDALAWLDHPADRQPAFSVPEPPEEASIERGFVLLTLGLCCSLLGVLTL